MIANVTMSHVSVSSMAYRPPSTHRPVIWLICALTASLLIWSCFGTLEIVVTARGRVISDGHVKAVQPAVSGSVISIAVREGDRVKRGQLLMTLDPTLFAADTAAVKEKIDQLRAEIARLEAEESGASPRYPWDGIGRRASNQDAIRFSREATYERRREELRASLKGRQSSLAAGESTITGLATRLAIAREREERARPHVGIAISRFQYLQWKDDMLVLEKDIATQRDANKRLSADVEEIRQQFLRVSEERKNSIEVEISEKQSQLTQLNSEYDKSRKHQSDTNILAPVDGYIQKLFVTTLGANVSSNDTLFIIVPIDTPLIIEVAIPNEDKGFTVSGQTVDIKFDAFPFQKYGRLSGRLEWISPDAELAEGSTSYPLTQSAGLRLPQSTSQYVYRGKVSPLAPSNPSIKLAPGLTGQVDIYTDRRRIIDFFLFPLEKNLDNAMKVR